MAPLPLESGNNGTQLMPVDGANMENQMGTISLGTLIQFMNQRTYSDLINLAEILPRKSDLDKKVKIVEFAQKTRQMYVRLLALVKWAASASKVDKCCHITAFLEKQNSLIVNTADKLFQMTKDHIVMARLPHFHVPAAVETLTTGSYNRLPLTIRQRILPPEPITGGERKSTLSRLEQIVQHRLVTTELPPQMRTCQIENGRVKFVVEHEFEVSLTLMSDSPTEPWRLLEVGILVEDKETGEGKELVHPLQVNYIHQVLQSRLQDNPNPLMEVYAMLHSFAQSLQLEVLYAQTIKIIEERLSHHIRIEEYIQGKSLTLTYWRELKQKDQTGRLGYRLTIQVDPTRDSLPLMLIHTPTLSLEEAEIAGSAIRSDHLSIERLLIHTIYLRTKTRLSELKQEFDAKLGPDADKCELVGSPAVLSVPILQPCFKSEQLLVTVNTHAGYLIAHVPQYDSFSRMKELQATLNGDKSKLDELMADLRFWIMVKRTQKTLQHLEATAHERLPMMYDSEHPIHQLSKHKIYLTFHRHPTYILIVEFHSKENSICEMEMNLLSVKEASIEDNPKDDSVKSTAPKCFLRAYRLMPLDLFVCTHGPTTNIDTLGEIHDMSISGKRKYWQAKEIANKKRKVPAYFLKDIAQVVAMCDEVFPLAHVSHELQNVGVYTTGVQVDDGGIGVCLRLVDLMSTKDISPEMIPILKKNIISTTIRTTVMLKFNSPQHCKSNRNLVVEYIVTNCPVQSLSPKEQTTRRLVTFTYEAAGQDSVPQSVEAMVADWTAMAKLYELVANFAVVYNASNEPSVNSANVHSLLGNMSSLKNFAEYVKVRSFNYKSITLGYGPNYAAYVTVKYNGDLKKFTLNFGMTGHSIWATNSQALLEPQYEDLLNQKDEFGLVHLVILLHNSYQPLLALSKLQPSLHPGGVDKISVLHSTQIFTIIAHSCTRVRIFYRNVYCLEVEFHNNGLISIRDGAFSSFHTSRVTEEATPIKGLKAFLSKYVDENAISRRRSQSEDDNPPTPVPMDDNAWPTPKPSSPARHGPMTPPVSSNPHTPASPHPVAVASGPHGNFTASPAGGGFPLASPPSLGNMNPSPAGGVMSHPSPGGLLSHPSPGGGFLSSNSPSGQALSVASPGFPAPSPVGGPHSLTSHSPAAYLGGSGPVTSMSRILPNRPYAAAIPTVLTHDAFHTLCTVPQTSDTRQTAGRCCIFEQFLGSTYLNKFLQSYLRNVDTSNQGKEQQTCQLRLESLIATFVLETIPTYNLALKLQPTPDYADKWSHEELQVLEYLMSRATAPPYKPQAVESVLLLLKFPFVLLKDCVRVIRLEMSPNQQQPPLKWNVRWCLTVPAHGKTLTPIGQTAIYTSKQRFLLYLQITRVQPVQPELQTEPCVIVLPVVHDFQSKKTHMGRRADPTPVLDASDRIYQTINDMISRMQFNPLECTFYPCIREILTNFMGHESQISQGHESVPPLGSPHMVTSASMMSTGGMTRTSTTVSQGHHYTSVQSPAGHIQPNLPMGPQSMSPMQSPMGSIGAMAHANMSGGMMQPGHVNRGMQGGMPTMGVMQPNQNNFSGNMMGQFQR